MYNITYLNENQTEYAPDQWGPAKPILMSGWYGRWLRIRDAWAVLRGDAAAVRWF